MAPDLRADLDHADERRHRRHAWRAGVGLPRRSFWPQAARCRRCPDLRPQFRSYCADPGGRLVLFCDTAFLRRLGLAAGGAAAVLAFVKFAPTRHRTLVTSLV